VRLSVVSRWSVYVGECGQGEKTDPDADNVQELAALIEIEKKKQAKRISTAQIPRQPA